MTDEHRITEIEARATAATEGPWGIWRGEKNCYGGTPRNIQTSKGTHRWICHVTLLKTLDAPQADDNAVFISHSREDIPYLLSLLRDRDAEIERLNHSNDVLIENSRWFADRLNEADHG